MRKQIFFIAILTGLTALSAVSSSQACLWCTDNQAIPVLIDLKAQARHQAEKSALLAHYNKSTGKVVSKSRVPTYLKHEGVCFTDQPTNRFYTDYLCNYFPRATTIVEELVPTMCVDALRGMLHSLVYFISSANWRYFVNNPADLKLELVHVVILFDQLTVITEMLNRASIDSKTKLITVAPHGQRAPAHSSLLQHFKKNAVPEWYDTNALYLDFIVRLAYIHVLHQDSTGSYRYHEQLQRHLHLVHGTPYEQLYTQVARLYTDLLKMLRQRAWGTQSGGKKITHAQSTTLEHWAERSAGMDELEAYVHSFIAHYECNVTGKFTHEYHPFMLDKTGASLKELEQRLSSENLPIIGRLMLMGYEEQGVPRYYTDFGDAYFSDEMAAKTSAGWSLQMFNRFGLLTGFLCKHANDMSAYAAKHNGAPLPLTHINADLVEIFDGYGTLFQEHAFGDAYSPVMYTLPRVEHQLVRMAMPGLCRELMHFWQTLYNNELKVTGKQHVVGTQDILFSIAYMRHLQKSQTPILHFYMGPDITYPIETSSLHKKEVTRHAQSFVKTFVPEQLVAHNNKKTAYIFCSFVDGVGKSTMLGNVQNWMVHGDKIEEYEHVDNSSSQLATVFGFSEDVIIADLPAQVSHFTYKPDGHVYVDTGALLDSTEQQKLIEYVAANKQQIAKGNIALERDTMKLLSQHGYDLTIFEEHNPEMSFMANVILLDKQATNTWQSFTHDGNYYLFDAQDPRHIRQRMPLATAPSHGLKNSCTEQMIFSLGVRFPLAYKTFVDDLLAQLKEYGAEQVVMVDFLSMYSRSSRENIRVNYIIQQIALLYKDFKINNSFYQDFVHNAQLLSLFEAPKQLEQFTRSLSYESWVRTMLYDILRECADDSIEAVDLKKVTEKIQAKLKSLPAHLRRLVPTLVSGKLRSEHESLKRAYGTTREYVTVQQFHAADLVALSRKLSSLFTKKVVNDDINELWGRVRDAKRVKISSMHTDKQLDRQYAVLDNGVQVEVLGRMTTNCKDRQITTPLLRQMRACWYASLSNLLYSQPTHDGDRIVVENRIPVAPVVALYDDEGQICVVQPLLEPVDKEYDMPEYSLFEVQPSNVAEDWGVFNDRLYLTNWRGVETAHAGVFGAGHEVYSSKLKDNENSWRTRPIVSALYIQFAKDEGDEHVLVHEGLFERFTDKLESLRMNFENWKKEAKKNGPLSEEEPVPCRQDKDQSGRVKQDRKTKVYHLRDDQVAGARLFLRAIATIDMIAKDPEADLASRRGEQKDFIANMRIAEWITLPWLYGMLPAQPLFGNYEHIQPLLKWNYFTQEYMPSASSS